MKDDYETPFDFIEDTLRRTAVRLIMFAVVCFCLGYLFG